MVGLEVIEKAKKEDRKLLTEVEAKQVLQAANIDVVQTLLATSKEEAVTISEKIGFPVVMKISSVDVVHKSDAGGVKLNLQNSEQVSTAYDEILASIMAAYPDADIEGVSIQGMAEKGLEVILGMSKDAQFGPMLMFGLGGVFVEILKDVSFRIVPLENRDATEMISEIKGYPLLQGYRGSDPVDVSALETMLLKISDLVTKVPEIKELDLNPVFAYENGALAVDARIILE